MRIRRLSTNHFQLTQLGFINAYLVAEDDGFTLIDTGMWQASQIMVASAKLGRPISRIGLTHAHTDHAGSVEALMKRLPGAELSLSRRESRLFAGDRTLDASEPGLKLRGDYVRSSLLPGRLLDEGDRLGSLRVLAVPGHTPGQVAFLDERDGVLFAGDAYSVLGGLAVAGDLRPLFPLPALATWSFELAILSAEKLISAGPTRLAVGHGRVLDEPISAMKAAHDRAGARSRRLKDDRAGKTIQPGAR